METENTNVNRQVSKLVNEVKVELSCKFAYFLHQEAVSLVKQAQYMLPPKLLQKQCVFVKAEASSTAGSEDLEAVDEAKDALLLESIMGRKILPVIHAFEEHLISLDLADSEGMKSVRNYCRSLLQEVVQEDSLYRNLERESIALAIIVSQADRMGLKHALLLSFISDTLQNKRITKICQVKKTRAFLLLKQRSKRQGEKLGF